MKIAVILNGISLKKKLFYTRYLPPLEREFKVDIFETLSRNHAQELASKAVYRKYNLVIAAGGDGTAHQVVNGLLQERGQTGRLPAFSVLPLGSGNDFARAVGARADVDQLVTKIRNFELTRIDVGEVHCATRPGGDKEHFRFFINVADTGMGPEVVDKVVRSGRPFGSHISYFQAIISTFFTYKPIAMRAQGDNFEWFDKMRTFAIANGRYFGSGLCIAPQAEMDDGIFDVFACGGVSVLDFILKTIPLKRGRRISHRKVQYHHARHVELTASQPLKIEADGEFCGWLPATVKVSDVKLEALKLR